MRTRIAIGILLLSISALSPAANPTATQPAIETGPNASLHGRLLFSKDDPWSLDVSKLPVDPNSAAIIASIGANKPLHPDFGTTLNGQPWGIPYVVVDGHQAKTAVTFDYADESDRGPYPIPANPPIEGGPDAAGDRHLLILDKDHWLLYELWHAQPPKSGGGDGARVDTGWHAGSGAVFDLSKPSTQRPAGWTSADAAGLPILPGLARYDEIGAAPDAGPDAGPGAGNGAAGKLTHALRFTVQHSRRAYVAPARHFASRDTNPNLPPMGLRVRLKAGFDTKTFPPTARVILDGLKTYGLILADNGGDWFISGAPSDQWNDAELETLKRVKGKDFEVVRMGEIVTK